MEIQSHDQKGIRGSECRRPEKGEIPLTCSSQFIPHLSIPYHMLSSHSTQESPAPASSHYKGPDPIIYPEVPQSHSLF